MGGTGDEGVRPGDVLAGKYRVDRVLGEGGMGVVVAAHHLQLEEKVALKFLLPGALKNPTAVARFTREARTAARIKSDHVARVTDVGLLEDGAPYMVMEYLEGGDLAGWLTERGPLPVDLAVDFVLQACVGVADAHARGVVHRDLKPANLFCIRRSDGELTIKVLDFGISKITDDVTGGSSGSMTKTASVMGTPYYMSPEQIRSSKWVDARTDVWALGVILFELLTARVPFDAESPMELAVKISAEPTPSLRLIRPEVPAALEAAVTMCLEKELAQRYSNVAELAQAIAPFGTRRAQALTERTSGILGGASLPLAQGATGSTPALGGTLNATGRTAGSMTKSSPTWLFAVVAVIALGGSFALVRAVVSWRLDATASSSSQQYLPPASGFAPPSATQAIPADAPPLSGTSSVAHAHDESPPQAAVTATAAPSPMPQPSPVNRPSRPLVAPSTKPAAPPPVSVTPKTAPSVDCTVPYTVDATGHHIYKPECNQ